MGLCKCPKRKVTQQFCFEHKVNVCEFCMVHDHKKCVVNPYLQWLEDGTFVPNCTLCEHDLGQDDCVRLLCYHILHWKCLNDLAKALPSNTPPAGYQCPDCHKTIFPSANSNSPIAQQLRNILANVEWARVGLGLSSADKSNVSEFANGSSSGHASIPQVIHNNPNSSGSIPVAVNSVVSHYVSSGSHSVDSPQSYTSVRKVHDSSRYENRGHSLDIDEDKYRTKSPFELLGRWLRSSQPIGRGSGPVGTYRRWIILGIILLLGFFTSIHYFLKLGRESADRDSSLDPAFNPHIRIGEN